MSGRRNSNEARPPAGAGAVGTGSEGAGRCPQTQMGGRVPGPTDCPEAGCLLTSEPQDLGSVCELQPLQGRHTPAWVLLGPFITH